MNEEWEEINAKLTSFLGICGCQRKLKSIVDVLVIIYDKGQMGEHNWTPEEYLILAMLDKCNLITHGVNCEYPIIIDMNGSTPFGIGQEERCDFWEWINIVKNNPNLTDN